MLGKTVTVESALETTGEPISLVVGPHAVEQVSVPGAALSFVRATGKDLGDSVPSVLSTFCHYQLFFPSEEAGRRWAQARGREDIVMLPVHQAFQLVRGWVERVFGAALEPRWHAHPFRQIAAPAAIPRKPCPCASFRAYGRACTPVVRTIPPNAAGKATTG